MRPSSLTSVIKTTTVAAAKGTQKSSKSLGIVKVTSSSQLPETANTSGENIPDKAAMPKKVTSSLSSKTKSSAAQEAAEKYPLAKEKTPKTEKRSSIKSDGRERSIKSNGTLSSGTILKQYKKAIDLDKAQTKGFSTKASGMKEADANKETSIRRDSELGIGADLKAENQQVDKSQLVGKIKLIGKEFDQDTLMFSHSLQKTADKYGVVIGLRTPSPLSQAHLKENYPTKNFHVKAKSSVVGPTAGFIAKEPKYSKVGPGGWKNQEKNIQKALDAGANLVDLSLSENQLKSAMKLGSLRYTSPGKYKANYHGETINFLINQPENKVLTEDGKPVQVLTNPPEKKGIATGLKPITADYDLFSIVPRENQAVNLRPLELGHNLALEAKSVSDKNVKGQQNDYLEKGGKEAFKKAIVSFTKPRVERGESDPDQGNIHSFGVTIINDINRNAKEEGYEGGKLCWHGDEEGNPFSGGFDPADTPIFYIPGQAPQQISSLEELTTFYDELRQAGYSPEASPKIGGVKSPRF